MSTPKGLIAYLIAQQQGDEDAEANWQEQQNAQANEEPRDDAE